MVKKTAVFLALFLILGLFGMPAGAYSAKSYALVEQQTGRLLLGGNEQMELPMASTTKIMTALLAAESGRLDETFTVTEQEIRVEGSSMGLLAGEKITLRNLVYGLMLESGNDAANTIACCLAGSVPAFADRMNARALQLGLYHTHFVNPSGLDADGHYTTALDLARLGAYAMQNPDFAAIAGTQKIRIPYNGSAGGRVLVNHNRLLKSVEGVIGIKTGFTKHCGRCLVSCARRGGVCLVAVTLHDPDDWDDHKALLDYGFGLLKSTPLFSPGNLSDITAQVVGGGADSVHCSYDQTLTAGLTAQEAGRVKMQVNLPRFVYAPVRQGQKLGEIVFTLDGETAAAAPLTADRGVGLLTVKPRANPFAGIWQAVGSFFSRIFGS